MKGDFVNKPIVIVTGSSGLIGLELCQRLKDRFQVVGLDQRPPSEPIGAVEHISLDLTSDESVHEALAAVKEKHGNRLASAIHLAAYYNFSGAPSPKYEQVTVQGTGRLLRGLRNFELEQFIFSSTVLVHAPSEPGRKINEDWPLDPRWAYPQSKVKTEELIHAERDSIPTVILRIAGVYDDECHSLPIANQIQRIYEKRLTGRVYPGDSSRGQPFLHLNDLIDAFLKLVDLRRELQPELTLLLGEPETFSYAQIQRDLGRFIHNESWPTIQIPKVMAKTGAWVQDKTPFLEESFIKPWMVDFADDHYALDITRAKTLLGWEPQHSLRTALPKMTAALKRDPMNWYRKNKLKWPQRSESQDHEKKAA